MTKREIKHLKATLDRLLKAADEADELHELEVDRVLAINKQLRDGLHDILDTIDIDPMDAAELIAKIRAIIHDAIAEANRREEAP